MAKSKRTIVMEQASQEQLEQFEEGLLDEEIEDELHCNEYDEIEDFDEYMMNLEIELERQGYFPEDEQEDEEDVIFERDIFELVFDCYDNYYYG